MQFQFCRYLLVKTNYQFRSFAYSFNNTPFSVRHLSHSASKGNSSSSSSDSSQSKERFASTVDYYVKYRPSYPKDVLSILSESYGLTNNTTIADIGSGTGIFTRLILENSNTSTLWAIEPNDSMRTSAEKYLRASLNSEQFGRFVSVNGSSESTTLPDHSVDLITAAQAFHWFNPNLFRTEALRILRRPGIGADRSWIALLWNMAQTQRSDFMRAYEQLLRDYGTDYTRVRAENVVDKQIVNFFRAGPNSEAPALEHSGSQRFPFTRLLPHLHMYRLPNPISMDWTFFRGRLLSTSYIPRADRDPERHATLLRSAEQLFHQHARDDRVTFYADTLFYMGQLAE